MIFHNFVYISNTELRKLNVHLSYFCDFCVNRYTVSYIPVAMLKSPCRINLKVILNIGFRILNNLDTVNIMST